MSALITRKISAKKKSVKPPLSAGEKLAVARKKLNIDMLEAERKTLIRAKYLEALEQSKFYELPLPVYTFGFVQTYASYLGLNAKRLLDQFQKEYGVASQKSGQQIILDTTVRPARVIVTPKLLSRGLVFGLLCLLVAYFGMQISSFAGVPALALDAPAQASEVSGDSITVSGSTDPGSNIKISGQRIPVTETGRFAQEVRLKQGVNTIIVEAENRLGKTRMQSRMVKVNTPATALLGSVERAHE